MTSKFKVGQEVELNFCEGGGVILKVSSYKDNKKEIDREIMESGWEQQTFLTKEELIWYLIDCEEGEIWTDEEEIGE
jgi:hypothetical protein